MAGIGLLTSIGSALMPSLLETLGSVGKTAIQSVGNWATKKVSPKQQNLDDKKFRGIIQILKNLNPEYSE
jgi:hypothetical protein